MSEIDESERFIHKENGLSRMSSINSYTTNYNVDIEKSKIEKGIILSYL